MVDWSKFGKPVETRRMWTPAKDNRGREHQVLLVLQETGTEDPPEWVVKLGETPGRWAVDTLMVGDINRPLAIDFGQGWAWMNVKEVMKEVQSALKR